MVLAMVGVFYLEVGVHLSVPVHPEAELGLQLVGVFHTNVTLLDAITHLAVGQRCHLKKYRSTQKITLHVKI